MFLPISQTLTHLVATGHLFHDHRSSSFIICIVNRFRRFGQVVVFDRPLLQLDQFVDELAYLRKRLDILFGHALDEVLRQRS